MSDKGSSEGGEPPTPANDNQPAGDTGAEGSEPAQTAGHGEPIEAGADQPEQAGDGQPQGNGDAASATVERAEPVESHAEGEAANESEVSVGEGDLRPGEGELPPETDSEAEVADTSENHRPEVTDAEGGDGTAEERRTNTFNTVAAAAGLAAMMSLPASEAGASSFDRSHAPAKHIEWNVQAATATPSLEQRRTIDAPTNEAAPLSPRGEVAYEASAGTSEGSPEPESDGALEEAEENLHHLHEELEAAERARDALRKSQEANAGESIVFEPRSAADPRSPANDNRPDSSGEK
ncbi:MAG: hypothetical protein ACXWCB_13135 [Acidimicrobiales bacterium]